MNSNIDNNSDQNLVSNNSDSKPEEKEENVASKDEQGIALENEPEYQGIVFSKCETNWLKYLLIAQLLFTILSFGIAILSIFRKESDLQMDRSSYWWYFLFCLIIFVSLYQSLNAINHKQDNDDRITCFFILTLVILIIDLIIFTRLFIVEFPPNGEWANKLKNWEVIILYVTTICRLISLSVTFGILVTHVNAYYERWDVDPNYKPEP